jgi:hypothetical protein
MVAVMDVGPTTSTPVKVTPVGPLTLAPAAKPVPVMVSDVVEPVSTLGLLRDVRVGAAITEKQVAQLPLAPRALLTVTV